MAAIDINCDMGESFGHWSLGDAPDAEILEIISSANVAAGFHAGDPNHMDEVVKLAARHGVAIGAHPGYRDLQGFGRRVIAGTPEEIVNDILYQLGALREFGRRHGVRIQHVKPHGALYNDMMRDPAILETVLKAGCDYGLPVMIAATANRVQHERLAASLEVDLMFEVFADRAYDEAGNLVPRSEPGSVLHVTESIVGQAISFARDRGVRTLAGSWLDLEADTICIHGDNKSSVAAARAVRNALRAL
jgi:UPF0271 protein